MNIQTTVDRKQKLPIYNHANHSGQKKKSCMLLAFNEDGLLRAEAKDFVYCPKIEVTKFMRVDGIGLKERRKRYRV